MSPIWIAMLASWWRHWPLVIVSCFQLKEPRK